MELGEKLRQARLEAGLSQRQLCGGEITRNMLSLIENGNAKPSMETLKGLAARLGRPVSWFLEEDVLRSPNEGVMERLRQCWDAGDLAGAAAAAAEFQEEDPVYLREFKLLKLLVTLARAEEALSQKRLPYARALLEEADAMEAPYCGPELARRRAMLWCRVDAAREPPELDGELLLRAELALGRKEPERCAALLDAMENRNGPMWNLLRGQAHEALGEYARGAACLHLAEDAYPKETAPSLERCYRELEDYKQAYFYACKQKKSEA